jgi:hypothetical protein
LYVFGSIICSCCVTVTTIGGAVPHRTDYHLLRCCYRSVCLCLLPACFYLSPLRCRAAQGSATPTCCCLVDHGCGSVAQDGLDEFFGGSWFAFGSSVPLAVRLLTCGSGSVVSCGSTDGFLYNRSCRFICHFCCSLGSLPATAHSDATCLRCATRLYAAAAAAAHCRGGAISPGLW